MVESLFGSFLYARRAVIVRYVGGSDVAICGAFQRITRLAVPGAGSWGRSQETTTDPAFVVEVQPASSWVIVTTGLDVSVTSSTACVTVLGPELMSFAMVNPSPPSSTNGTGPANRSSLLLSLPANPVAANAAGATTAPIPSITKAL